jgi:DNA-binding NtrC family response regulator
MQSAKAHGTVSVMDRSRVESTLSAMVVEQRLSAALPIVTILTASEFHVTFAESFVEAKRRLSERPPALLITALKLGEYNGLGLVVRAKSVQPHIAAVVISTVDDVVLQGDAEAMGATFVTAPVSDADLKAAVFRTLFREPGSASPIRPPFERRLGDRRHDEVLPCADRRLANRRMPWPLRLDHGPKPQHG